MPDVYVPIDTLGYNEMYFALNAKGVLNDFLYNSLIKEHAPDSLDEFVKTFTLSPGHYQQILALASAKGIKYNPRLFKVAERHINVDMKAMLARYYFGDLGFYKVLNSVDNVVSRSLALLK